LADSRVTVRARQKAPRRRTWTVGSDPLSTRPPSAVAVPLDPDAPPAVRLGRSLAGLARVTGRGGTLGVALGSRGGGERQLAGGLGGGLEARGWGDLATATRTPDAGNQPSTRALRRGHTHPNRGRGQAAAYT
jgi:hypothetical protein